jgi:glycosyltransferase involved in cell wall biosynthesis
MTPRVTAIVGSYNSAATLERALQSLLAQTVSDLELIVVDDGSADDSPAIARRVAGRDPRVRPLALERNAGIAGSLNVALREARAPVIAVQDADDHSAPERLERQLALLDARPEVAVVGVRMAEVDEAGHELAPRTVLASGDVTGLLLRHNPVPNTGAAFRRDAALAAGGYDPRYRYATEYDLWLRIAERHRVWCLPEVLATRVMGTANVAARAEAAQTREAIAIRLRAMARRRSLRGADGVLLPALSLATPPALKRARRRRLGQAP